MKPCELSICQNGGNQSTYCAELKWGGTGLGLTSFCSLSPPATELHLHSQGGSSGCHPVRTPWCSSGGGGYRKLYTDAQAHISAYQGSHVGPTFRLQSFVTQPPTKSMTTGHTHIFGNCNYSTNVFQDYKQPPTGVKPWWIAMTHSSHKLTKIELIVQYGRYIAYVQSPVCASHQVKIIVHAK